MTAPTGPGTPGDPAALPETIAGALRRGAALWPDRHFVRLPDDSTWTRREALDEAAATAGRFGALGIGAGDRVVLMMPNSADWLRCWWGLGLIGAIVVPFNPALRGTMLHATVDTIDPALIVIDRGMEDRFAPAERGRLMPVDALMALAPAADTRFPDIAPEDPHLIVMTSGTTGPSKGSLTANRQLCRQASWQIDQAGVGADDVLLADMPLFHFSGISPITLMMRSGGSFVLRVTPTMTNYWATVRQLKVTFGYLVGTMSAFLQARAPSAEEREHSLRFLLTSPFPADIGAFNRRFGIMGLATSYGSSEASIVVVHPPGPPLPRGSCGRLRPEFEARVVDDDDRDLPDGAVGEMIVRNPTPGTMSLGYHGDPAATAEAWRGGWFHTGDLMKRDADGFFYWMDRKKDSLRRRGENISSFEVEREVASHPAIAEAACVAVPSDIGGDDEVKVFVVAREGAALDPVALVYYLAGRMPYFAVPRYFEPIDAIPKTPTNRAQKFVLRAMGNSDRTWDREAHGLIIGRDGTVKATT